MFFVYLAVFIIIVITPFFVSKGFWIFSEDETEALVLLFAGVVSFVIYRLRDYQVFEALKERVLLQRKVARAQKELSKSYSYIGQANRRSDIMYEVFADLSHLDVDNCDEAVLCALESLPYSEDFCLKFIDLKNKKVMHSISTSNKLEKISDKMFFERSASKSYRKKDLQFVYAEATKQNLRTCIVLPQSENVQDDIDFFKALTAYFTMVYIFQTASLAQKK